MNVLWKMGEVFSSSGKLRRRLRGFFMLAYSNRKCFIREKSSADVCFWLFQPFRVEQFALDVLGAEMLFQSRIRNASRPFAALASETENKSRFSNNIFLEKLFSIEREEKNLKVVTKCLSGRDEYVNSPDSTREAERKMIRKMTASKILRYWVLKLVNIHK